MTDRIIVDLTAGRQASNTHYDSTGHGYSVYYNGHNEFVETFLNKTSIWGGFSNTYETQSKEKFRYWEFSYENFDLFTLPAIKRLFASLDVALDVATEKEDMRKFWFAE